VPESPSVFTRIIARELPSTILEENDRVIAIEPLEKMAPVHLLVIPKTEQYRDVVELAAGDPALLSEVVGTAARLAAEYSSGEFRLVFNTGESAGQTVFHVHAHVLGGALEEGSLAT
jgi:histidine triad (HIT) family protein